MPGIVRAVCDYVTRAAIVVGVAAAAACATGGTPGADTPPPVPAPQRVQTLTVTPDPAGHYLFECATESGPADGAFRWRVCVPDESPDGAPVADILEDGSASYGDGWSIASTDDTITEGTVVGEWDAPDAHTATGAARAVAKVAKQRPQPQQQSQPRPAAGSCSEPLPTAQSGTTATPQPQPQTGGKVNVNTATTAQLEALPGIGEVLAARIVQLRPYSSVDDLHRVARIPFSKVAPLVTV